MTTWKLPRESKEWVGPITVTIDAVEIGGFEVAITSAIGRPTVWSDPLELDSDLGILVGPGTGYVLEPGVHKVWARVTDLPEEPVLEVGTVIIS